jgi:hypothetical protein
MHRCRINLHSEGIPRAMATSDTISLTISERTTVNCDTIHHSNPKTTSVCIDAISESNSDHSYCRTMHQEGVLRQWLCDVVSEHFSSRYVGQLALSISSHVCNKGVLGRNVLDCSAVVDSVLDARDQ